MRRREFIGLVGAAAAWPCAGLAQRPTKPAVVGFLVPGTPTSFSQRLAASVKRLGELGGIDGRTITIEYRWAEAQRFDEIAAELVRLKVDVIFTTGTPPVIALRKLTSEIPIVFVAAGDPVGTGLVVSLARPGANITGLSNQSADIVKKRLGLLREMVPNLSKLAVMAKIDNISAAKEMREVQTVAAALGMQPIMLEVREADDITAAFAGLAERADALYVVPDSLVTTNALRIGALALGARLPTIHGARELVQAGGLMSYGANYPALYRRAAEYIDKILRGAKPARMPIEQPTQFDLVINLSTAKELSLSISPSLIARADDVIE